MHPNARHIPRDIHKQILALIPHVCIKEQGATTLSETLRNMPGITLQAGEGGGASNTAGDMFNMRGFNASNSLFVDGVRDDSSWCRATCSISSRSKYSWDRPDQTWAEARRLVTSTCLPRFRTSERRTRQYFTATTTAPGRQSISTFRTRRLRQLVGQGGVSSERPVAGRWRARPSRGRVGKPRFRAVDRIRSRYPDATDGVRPDHAPG